MSEPVDDVNTLLDADRELNDDEQSRLRRVSERGWASLRTLVHGRARAVYSVADPGDFSACVMNHMGADQRLEMIAAEVYQCPKCSRVLKDRMSPVASSILLERGRLRTLWLEVEDAGDDTEFNTALDRFRRALGLSS